MNIRLDDNLRIRLDNGDVRTLTRGEFCDRIFSIDDVPVLRVSIVVGSISFCKFDSNQKTVQITVSDADFQTMMRPALAKQGIDVGPANLQVDIFKAGKQHSESKDVAAHD